MAIGSRLAKCAHGPIIITVYSGGAQRGLHHEILGCMPAGGGGGKVGRREMRGEERRGEWPCCPPSMEHRGATLSNDSRTGTYSSSKWSFNNASMNEPRQRGGVRGKPARLTQL
jgi:hypothetical protein